MLDLDQIMSFYPEYLRSFRKNLLREYLQYKILQFIFESEHGQNLAFMGGTASRIIHSNTRFSEDLDFDNLGLKKENFRRLASIVKRKLRLEGYKLEIDEKLKEAYTLNIRIKDILFDYDISRHRQEKLLIKVNAEPQNFEYKQEKIILNKFDVFVRIGVVPVDILLAQKIYAIFNRQRPVGRDFYDAVFLFGKTRPNFEYLRLKLGIKDKNELKHRLLLRCKELDFNQLAKEVEPFLFTPSDSKKVFNFCEYVEGYKF